MKKGISVILLTWNGLSLLKECLPKVLSNLDSWSFPNELILVDNGSKDGTISYLKEHYPDIKLIAHSKNLGFGRANNLAAKEATFETLLFLNNDLYLDDHFIEPLYETLEEDSVFAVAPKILRWDKQTIDDGLRFGGYESGLFSVALETDDQKVNQHHWVTFFCGACFLCKKELFLKWGGFDPLYTPYAWEDLDLGYRAWKRGYKIAYVPEAVAFHKREATTRGAFSNLFFISLMWRNKFIFMWKNLHSGKMIWNHLAWLPWKLIKFLLNGRWRYVIGFLRTIPFIPFVLIERNREKKESKFTDEEVLNISFTIRENKKILLEVK